jgi:hypothetical protein
MISALANRASWLAWLLPAPFGNEANFPGLEEYKQAGCASCLSWKTFLPKAVRPRHILRLCFAPGKTSNRLAQDWKRKCAAFV